MSVQQVNLIIRNLLLAILKIIEILLNSDDNFGVVIQLRSPAEFAFLIASDSFLNLTSNHQRNLRSCPKQAENEIFCRVLKYKCFGRNLDSDCGQASVNFVCSRLTLSLIAKESF